MRSAPHWAHWLPEVVFTGRPNIPSATSAALQINRAWRDKDDTSAAFGQITKPSFARFAAAYRTRFLCCKGFRSRRIFAGDGTAVYFVQVEHTTAQTLGAARPTGERRDWELAPDQIAWLTNC
jgi:hypothetical protein